MASQFSKQMGIGFEIHYEENPNGMYFTGQMVKGRAVIHVTEAIPFKGIQLRVRGYAKVRWTENNSSSDSSSTDTYFDEIQYFDSVTECIDTKGLEQTLNSGTYSYNFACILPTECPSSFEGTFGRIRYDTKIIVVRPRAFNKSYSMGFSVLKIFDLNHHPNLRIPMQMEEIKHFCCGPCKSRPLVLTLEIPRTSYVPGDFIEFKAKLINNSSTKVEQLRVVLNLIALYKVRTSVRTKLEKIQIAKKKYGAFQSNTLEFKESLQVPPTPPTCTDLCEILQVSYEVAVLTRVKGAHVPPSVAIPVVIGNIPFVERSVSAMTEQNIIKNLTNGSPPIPTPDADYPPPSYEEATYRQNQPVQVVLNQPHDDKISGHFTPRYTFYGALPKGT